MTRLPLVGFALGVLVALYGIYVLGFEGENSGIIYLLGGIVITAIAAGLFSKAHSKGNTDAG
jgi:hypothetical protein